MKRNASKGLGVRGPAAFVTSATRLEDAATDSAAFDTGGEAPPRESR